MSGAGGIVAGAIVMLVGVCFYIGRSRGRLS